MTMPLVEGKVISNKLIGKTLAGKYSSKMKSFALENFL